MPWNPQAGTILHNDLETIPQNVLITFTDENGANVQGAEYDASIGVELPPNIRIAKSNVGVRLRGYPDMRGLFPTDDSITAPPTFISFKGSKPVERTNFAQADREFSTVLKVSAKLATGKVEEAEYVLRVLRRTPTKL